MRLARRLKKVGVYILITIVLLSGIGICTLVVHLTQWRQEALTGPAFGDGGSVMIPINPENALSIGDSVMERDFIVSLQSTGQHTNTEGLEILGAGWTYWYVTVVFQNKSPQTLFLDPLGMSRIQGMLTQNQGYTYPYKNFGETLTDKQGWENFEIDPGEEITTTLIYRVPLENDLFWIFGERDNSKAVFQVR